MIPSVPTPAAARERRWRTKAACTQEQDLRPEELQLAFVANFGDEQMSLIAVSLLGREHRRSRPIAALVLPLVETTSHGHNIAVPELTERLGSEGRSNAACAMNHNLGGLLTDSRFDLSLKVSSRNEHRPGDRPLLEFIGFADIQDHSSIGVKTLSLSCGDLLDLGFGCG